MKIGALRLFERTSSRRTVNIAAWHSRHSLTWRWVLCFTRRSADEAVFPLWQNGMIRIPFVGRFEFCSQQPMWYRDLWNDRSMEERNPVLVGMPNEWRLMDSAPRDGSPILIALGSDCTSSAVYTGGPHPWKFIDMKGPGRPILNGMRDGEYGPTGWMPLPEWKRPEHVTVRQIRDAMMATQDDPALVADASLPGNVRKS